MCYSLWSRANPDIFCSLFCPAASYPLAHPLLSYGQEKDFREPQDHADVISYARMKQHEAKGKGNSVFVTDGADGMVSVKMSSETFQGLKSGKINMKKLME